jgi:hypothetical protein
MGSIIKLVTSWNEHNEAQVVEPAKSLSAREEVYGPFIENNTQRRQIQYEPALWSFNQIKYALPSGANKG